MMMVPEAANMPQTPWQTEILCRSYAAHLAHALMRPRSSEDFGSDEQE